MFAVRLLWMVACSPAVFSHLGDDFNSTAFGGLLYEKRGNVSLAGVFGRRSGKECNGEVERGLEEIISAIWTIEALNAYQYLPGMTIGLSVFDVCEPLNDQTTLRKMAEELSRFDEEAINMVRQLKRHFATFSKGIIATTEISKKLEGISERRFPDSNIVRIKHIVGDDTLTDITTQLLVNLQWMNVSAAIFDSVTALNSFDERALEEGISVRESVLVNCSSSCMQLRSFEEVEQSVVVVIASFVNIARLADKFNKENTKLILTPTDFLFDFSLSDLPKDTIVCLPSMQDKRSLSGHLRNILRHKDFFTRTPPVKGPLFVGTAATIVRFLKPFRTAFQVKCRDENSRSEQPCAPATHVIGEIKGSKTRLPVQETTDISLDDVEEALKVLKIEPNSYDEMFLCIASVVKANASEDVAIFQVLNLKLKTFRPVPIMIKDHPLSTRRAGGGAEKEAREWLQTKSRRKDLAANLLQEDGSPSAGNLPEGNLSTAVTAVNGTGGGVPKVPWRYLTWVSVNTCVGLVGVTCTLSVMLFVVIKICKDHFLEGSPYFTLVLMVSVVLTYMSSLPFHMEFPEDGFMCGYRKCAPPMVFALLFSLLLSRSLMVAFSEAGGGSGHINGYLQSVLSIFMIGVQVSITTQNWIFAKGIYDSTCDDIYDNYNIIFALVYDFLLLILLACVSPFIVRSKRNCKEGLLFSISVFFITIVWSAWISFYVLLPNEHKDAAVVVGLNSTASVLLLCIFIPQMYLMAAPFSRDQTIRALSSSLHTNALAGGSHADFKSSLALNDCAYGSYKNSQVGCANPSFLTSRPNGSTTPGATDSFIGDAVRARTPEPSRSD